MEYPSFLLPLSSEERENRDWSLLPENVLFIIISQLFMLSDIFSFANVCSGWISVLKPRLQTLNIKPNMSFKRGLPMLLTLTNDSSEGTRNLYNIPDAVIYDLKLPMPYNNRCIGSSYGWLIFIDCLSFVITLFNPFYFGSSKGTICLPPFFPAEDTSKRMKEDKFEFFSDYYICKAILSSNPSSSTNGYVLMMIYGELRNLAYYNSEDSTWTCVATQEGIFDMIYHQGNFLAIDFWGQAYVYQGKSIRPDADSTTEPVVGPVGGDTRRYVMQTSDGNILQVVRLLSCTRTTTLASSKDVATAALNTLGFLVYKLVKWDDRFEWFPMSSIGDGALFLGDNCSTFVKASNFPGVIGNAIYYTADYPGDGSMYTAPHLFKDHQESGIYHLSDESFHRLNISFPEQKNHPPPIWLLPSL